MSSSEPAPGDSAHETGDATRRTHLANERTLLAWWRTGLTAVAVGVGVGRVVPELSDANRTAYAVLGACYVVYGIVLGLAGSQRQQQIEQAVRAGRWRALDQRVLMGLTIAGALLALATLVLILFDA
jgi:putative membrane protein